MEELQDTPIQEVKHDAPIIKGKEKFMIKLKNKYNDKEWDDDDALFGQIDTDYDDYESQISGYKKNEEDMVNMFAADPRSAAFLTNWRKGEDPTVQYVRQFGQELIESLNDPQNADKIAEANSEFLERVAKNKQLEDEYELNIKESLDNIDAMQSEENMSEEELDDLLKRYLAIVGDAIVGKLDVKILKMLKKADSYDNDIAMARAEGEIDGKNAKIDEKKRMRTKGSPIPVNLGGRGGDAQAKAGIGFLDDVQSEKEYMDDLGIKRTNQRR